MVKFGEINVRLTSNNFIMLIYRHNEINLRFYIAYIKRDGNNNYEQLTVSELKNLARERGKRRYSRLNKAGLIKRFREPTPPIEPTLVGLTQWLETTGYQDTIVFLKMNCYNGLTILETKY